MKKQFFLIGMLSFTSASLSSMHKETSALMQQRSEARPASSTLCPSSLQMIKESLTDGETIPNSKGKMCCIGGCCVLCSTSTLLGVTVGTGSIIIGGVTGGGCCLVGTGIMGLTYAYAQCTNNPD